MKRIIGLLFIILTVTAPIYAQCKAENKAFKSGETLVYDLYFNWKFVWAKAGTASMNITEVYHDNKPAYQCNLLTQGSKTADRFFVMRDTLVSIISKDMQPLYYRKGAVEGKRYKVDEVWYNYDGGKCNLKQRYRNSHGNISERTHSSVNCIYDMLSIMLRARSFDVSQYKKGQRIQFLMADGDEVEEQTLIYRGKDKFKMEGTGTTYNCLVFSFVEMKNGKEKEVITFYITDDDNHLPVRLDMFLNFGSAKAFLKAASGVRNPSTSIVKK